MKTLQSFIEEYTNADSFFEESRPHKELPEHIELDFFNNYLLPNGAARWWINALLTPRNGFEMREQDILIIEERLIHPSVMCGAVVRKVWDVLCSLNDIQTELIMGCEHLGDF